MQLEKLISDIGKEKGILTTRELKSHGLNHYQINDLIDDGTIERIKRGVYIFNDTYLTEQELVQKIIPTGIFCMHSAAMLYNYSTYVPNTYHLAIESKERYTLPDHPPIKLYYWKKSQLELGVKTVKRKYSEIKVYDKEKTVCDFIKFRKKEERSVVSQVIRAYLNDSERDLNKLWSYSEKLAIRTILKEYLYVLI